MVQINFAQRSVNVKIVYYGPGMSGKTTNLEVVHQRAPEGNRGELTSISTDGDRTLFFDFMPLDLGTVAGMRTQFQLYTVPGQVYYNSTRKLVLQGVDGVIFIADSSAAMLQENIESLRNLQENLIEYGKSIESIPWVIQYNKRDLPDAMPIEELQRVLNPMGVPAFEGVANTGQGVFPTLKALAARVLESIHSNGGSPRQDAPAPARAAVPAAAAPAAPAASSATGYYPQPAIPQAHPVPAAAHAATPAAPVGGGLGTIAFGAPPPAPAPAAPMAFPQPAAAQHGFGANAPALDSTALRLRMPQHGGMPPSAPSPSFAQPSAAPAAPARTAKTRASGNAPARGATAPAPQPAAAPAAVATPRLRQRAAPMPTPKGGASKATQVAVIFLGLALVAGALVAKFVFNLF